LVEPVPDDPDSLSGTAPQAGAFLKDKDAMQDLRDLGGNRVAGRCVGQAGQCPTWTKCCPGSRCTDASTRAFCE
jgi:hypothetical protein